MGRRTPARFRPDAEDRIALTHYTCPHGAARIRREGVIRPMPQFHLEGQPWIWLADYQCRRPGSENAKRILGFWPEEPDDCDKTAAGVRVSIRYGDLTFWPELKDRFPEQWERSCAVRGAKPWFWWMTHKPIELEPQ